MELENRFVVDQHIHPTLSLFAARPNSSGEFGEGEKTITPPAVTCFACQFSSRFPQKELSAHRIPDPQKDLDLLRIQLIHLPAIKKAREEVKHPLQNTGFSLTRRSRYDVSDEIESGCAA